VSSTTECWDNCNTDTFSRLWIEEFIRIGGNEVTPKTVVYWLLPGKTLSDGLCLIEKDADILAMMQAVREERNLHIMVDHGDFVRTLRDHVVVPIPSRYRRNQMEAENPQAGPSTVNEDVGQGIEAEVRIEVQRSSSSRGKNVVCEEEDDGEGDDGEEGDGDTDTEFYDSDYDA
jgi:hypothetical protein